MKSFHHYKLKNSSFQVKNKTKQNNNNGDNNNNKSKTKKGERNPVFSPCVRVELNKSKMDTTNIQFSPAVQPALYACA